MNSNDQLLNDLHQWAGAILDFHPTVEIVPGLRGGFWNQPADGAAAFSAKGAPVVALNSDYQRWPAAHLKYVFLHECAHHRLKHTTPAMRATAERCAPEPHTQQLADYTKRIEQQADQVTASYTKSFEAWQERRKLEQLQKDVEFIKWALRQRGVLK